MSNKSFAGYTEELKPERGKYHLIVRGNLYLINFAVNRADLVAEHKREIDHKVVPFIVRALTSLGPGAYKLHVIGSASATGTNDDNILLGQQRAYAAAMYAIKGFEEQQKKNPALAKVSLEPEYSSIGNIDSLREAKLLHLNTRAKIEKNQPHYRSAMFRFRAALHHPAEGSIFQIREIYFFKFKPQEESLPEALKWLKKKMETPWLKYLLDKIFAKYWKPVEEAIEGLLGAGASLGTHMVKYAVPERVDYCFEVKDYRETHALYRFAGIGHKDAWSVLELLSFLSKISAILKVIVAIAKLSKQAEDLARKLEALTESVQQWVIDEVRKIAGAGAADALEKAAKYLKEGTVIDHISAPGSDWTAFRYYDESPNHNVISLEGPARRTAIEAGMYSSVDIEFGGYVYNHWSAYNAEARIVSSFSVRNSLWGTSTSLGKFQRLRGPYGADLTIGPATSVTD